MPYIKWNLTKNCSLACKFCHNAMDRVGWATDLDKPALERLLFHLRESEDVVGLTLLGGEPTEARFFFEVCEGLEGAGFPFGFVTAGHSLDEERYRSVITNPNLGFIGFSIDSLDASIVRSIRGHDILETQLANLKWVMRLRESEGLSFDVFVNTVFMKKNADEIPRMAEHFYERGVSKFQILKYSSRNLGERNADALRPDCNAEVELVRRLAEQHEERLAIWDSRKYKVEYCFLSSLGHDYVREKFASSFPRGRGHVCPMRRDTLFLASNGGAYPCDSYRPFFGASPETSLDGVHRIQSLVDLPVEDIFNSDFHRKTRLVVGERSQFDNILPCRECPHLLVDCVPCSVSSSDKSQTFVMERCAFYHDALQGKD